MRSFSTEGKRIVFGKVGEVGLECGEKCKTQILASDRSRLSRGAKPSYKDFTTMHDADFQTLILALSILEFVTQRIIDQDRSAFVSFLSIAAFVYISLNSSIGD